MNKPIIVVGSSQKNAYWGAASSCSPCITAACGMGGGHIPMIIEIAENEEKAD